MTNVEMMELQKELQGRDTNGQNNELIKNYKINKDDTRSGQVKTSQDWENRMERDICTLTWDCGTGKFTGVGSLEKSIHKNSSYK